MAEQRRIRVGDAEREVTLTALQEAHAAGRLDLSELDERQTKVLRSRYVEDLLTVVADLPEGDGLFSGAGLATVTQPAAPAQRLQGDSMTRLAFMGGHTTTPEKGVTSLNNFCWWGGAEIDLTECMGPGVVFTLTSFNVMGGTQVFVPEGVKVVDNTIPLMGGCGVERDARGDGSNGTLVIRGLAFWGGQGVSLSEDDTKGLTQSA